jgi:hypothetical protein
MFKKIPSPPGRTFQIFSLPEIYSFFLFAGHFVAFLNPDPKEAYLNPDPQVTFLNPDPNVVFLNPDPHATFLRIHRII